MMHSMIRYYPWMLRWRSLALSQDRLSLVCRLGRAAWALVSNCGVGAVVLSARAGTCCDEALLGAGAPVAEPLGLSDEPEWVAAVSAALVADGFAGVASVAPAAIWLPMCDRFVRALVCAPIATVDADPLVAAGVASAVEFTTMAAATGAAGREAVVAFAAVALPSD